MLQNAGLGLVRALGGPSSSLWFTMESRRMVLEEEANPKEENGAEPGAGEGAEAGEAAKKE